MIGLVVKNLHKYEIFGLTNTFARYYSSTLKYDFVGS